MSDNKERLIVDYRIIPDELVGAIKDGDEEISKFSTERIVSNVRDVVKGHLLFEQKGCEEKDLIDHVRTRLRFDYIIYGGDESKMPPIKKEFWEMTEEEMWQGLKDVGARMAKALGDFDDCFMRTTGRHLFDDVHP